MTDTTAGNRGGVGVRLFVEGGALVRRTFDQVADSGKKMWGQIALGEKAANPAIRALSAGVGEAKSGVEGLANRAGMAGSALAAFGFAGVALAAVLGTVAMAATAAFTAMGDAAALVDSAELLGVTAERLQEWRYVADEAGVETAKFEGNLEKLNGVLGKFKLGIGDGKLKPVFEELGITKEQLQNIENADQLMDLLADTLGQVQDRAKQVALAKALGVEEMLPALRLGSEELGRLRDEAHDLGLVLNQETVAALDEADRQMERAGQQMRIIRDTAVAPLAGAFADVTSKIAETSVEIANMTSQLPSWSQALVQFMTKLPVIGLPIKGYLAALAKTGIGPDGQGIGSAPTVTDGNEKSDSRGGFELAGHNDGKGGGSNSGDAGRLKREEDQRNQRILRVQERLARAQDEVDRADDLKTNMSIDDHAHYQIVALQRERAARLREIARDEEEYKNSNGLRGLSEAEAEQLRLKQDELFEVKAAGIELEKRRDMAERRLRDEEEMERSAIEYLELESQMTRTAGERYRIEREILLSTQALARKRKAEELENDPELKFDEAERQRRMGVFDRNANRQVEVFDDRENERLKQQFKGYGREVVQAMKDGRIGEYIGERIQEKLLDAALEQLFQLFEMAKNRGGAGGSGSGGFWGIFGGGQSDGWPFSRPIFGNGGGTDSAGSTTGGSWMTSVFKSVASVFGGARASGGGTRAGQFYSTVEHGRPELLMIGGTGHVTSAAETARLLQDLTDPQIYGGGATTLQQRNVFDFKGAVVTQDLINSANAAAKSAAQNAFDGAREVVPSDRARQDRYTRGRRP